MTKSRIFPIQQEPACLLKWAWSSVFLNTGTSASCHRTKHYSFDLDSFENFHNLPGKLEDRQKMLNGEWPGNGCEYCRSVEQAGGYSDRQMQLDAQADPQLTPIELYQNSQSLEATPTILEVYFTNTCNMKCVYCGPAFSSSWEEENKKFDLIDYKSNNDYPALVEKFWLYLEKHYQHLRRFHILGGEPFLLKEFEEVIEFWDQHPNPDLVLNVISNLNVPTKRFNTYLDRITQLAQHKKIHKLQLTASLDAWGPEQEYARYGLDLDLWRKNFEYVIDNEFVSLSINSTISSLTVKTMPLLMQMINQWNQSRPHRFIEHSFQTALGITDPAIFGDFFYKDFDNIYQMMPEENSIQKSQKQNMQGLVTKISKSKLDPNKVKNFKNYLDKLDQRRNTNWKALFPWLDQNFSV